MSRCHGNSKSSRNCHVSNSSSSNIIHRAVGCRRNDNKERRSQIAPRRSRMAAIEMNIEPMRNELSAEVAMDVCCLRGTRGEA